MEIICDDPWIQTEDVGFFGEDFPRLEIRMKNGTAGKIAEVFWRTLGNPAVHEKPVTFAIRPNDSQLTTYSIDLSSHPLWKGKIITGLRIDPEAGVARGEVEIESIAVIQKKEFPVVHVEQLERDSAIRMVKRAIEHLERR
jgi:hypothetical protein